MKIFRIAKDKKCPETLQITAFSGHFLYRCQHGEDALPPGVLHRLCRSAAGSSRSGGGHGLGHPVHRAIAKKVIAIKAEVEKIREQVQNIE